MNYDICMYVCKYYTAFIIYVEKMDEGNSGKKSLNLRLVS